MSQEENATPKKKFKKWQIIVLVLIVFAVIGQFTGGGDTASTEKTSQTTEATAAPEYEVDIFTQRACRKFREFAGEAGKGILTISEMRAEFQDTYQAAQFSEVPVITEAATATLAALTAVDPDSLSVAADVFVKACNELGQ
jgi:hypothetical protein